MIGKIVGAFVGDKLAKQTWGISGPTGAALGFIAPAILRRLSLPAMAALAVGGYAAKKLSGKGSTGSGSTY